MLAVFEGVPQFEISRDELSAGVKAIDLLTEKAAVFASKGEMRKLVQSGGISVNKEKLADAETVIDCSSLLNEKIPAGSEVKELLSADCKIRKMLKTLAR